MKQLSQNLRTGKLSIDEAPAPMVQSGQLLVQTAFSLISAGTERTKIETGRKSLVGKALSRPDQVRQVVQSISSAGLQSTYQKVKTRLDSRSPLGYSAAGVVLQTGPGVNEFKPGDRVACGGASAAHAEVITVPRNLCVHVPESVDLETAAYTTVGAIAMQGIRQADARLGEYMVVIGLGLVGQLTVQMLKASGCSVMGFDLDKGRVDLAVQLGADAASSSELDLKNYLAHHTGSMGADAVIITAGTSSNRPVELAGELCREKGKVVVVGAVGLTLPREPYYHKELDFVISRSYGPGRYDVSYEEKGQDYPYGYVRWTERRNMAAFLELAAAGKINIKPLTTNKFSLDQAEEAYGLISGKVGGGYMGVLFEYDQAPIQLSSSIHITDRNAQLDGHLGVGVIGAGNFAQSMLLPHLKKNSQAYLRGVTTIAPLESRDVAERFAFNYAASSPEEIFKDPEVKAVLIATRHDTHADLAVQSLKAGKAIHLEKPLAMTIEELEHVIDVYHECKNAFLMVGFNRRFAPMVQEAFKFFANRSEPLAMTYRINAGFIPLDHWSQDPQQGGGRIVGEVCHFIDLLQFFASAPVQNVYAQAVPNQGKYNNDNVAITVSLGDGSIGTILYAANGDKSLPKEYLEIFGEGKTAILEDYRSLSLIKGGRKSVSHQGARDKGHGAETVAWVDAIREGMAEPVPFEMAVTATRATLAVLESINTGMAISITGKLFHFASK